MIEERARTAPARAARGSPSLDSLLHEEVERGDPRRRTCPRALGLKVMRTRALRGSDKPCSDSIRPCMASMLCATVPDDARIFMHLLHEGGELFSSRAAEAAPLWHEWPRVQQPLAADQAPRAAACTAAHSVGPPAQACEVRAQAARNALYLGRVHTHLPLDTAGLFGAMYYGGFGVTLLANPAATSTAHRRPRSSYFKASARARQLPAGL